MDYEKMLFYTHSTSKMSLTNCLAPFPLQKQQTATPLTFKVEPQQQLQAVKTNTNSNTFLTATATSVDPYATYADNFDLSLLPQDCCESPTANIPTIVFQYTGCDNTKTTATTPLTPTSPPQIKIEQHWLCLSKEIKQEPNHSLLYEHQLNANQLQPPLSQQQQHAKTPNLLIPPPPYPHIYPSPQSSPAQSEYNTFANAQFAGCYDSLSSSRSSLYPSSPCPSIDASHIKQELHILPPSPPESNCETPSPHSSWADIKSEPIDADVETLVDLKSLLEEQAYNDLSSVVKIQSPKSAVASSRQQQDHQLLRGYLEDTTFQLKHALKPLALASIIDSLQEVRGDIEPVISLCLEHAKRDAEETCAKLQISHDPNAWSAAQVHAWLRSTTAQFKLPQIIDLEIRFHEDGAALILLSEEEFTRRAPESGSTLHAQLEIWKLAFSDGYQGIQNSTTFQQQINEGNLNGTMQEQQQQQDMWSTPTDINMEDASEDENDAIPSTSAAADAGAIIPTNVAALTTAITSGNAVTAAPAAAVTAANTPEVKRPGNGRNGGSHIHLWQFLKELLAVPHINGTAIRWIDRSKGIFKIEDSVRVAKLWGKRKNRPAMNYDKLSRSIRQYYKKGIMKKTERSQRLVYQFCHPYHM